MPATGRNSGCAGRWPGRPCRSPRARNMTPWCRRWSRRAASATQTRSTGTFACPRRRRPSSSASPTCACAWTRPSCWPGWSAPWPGRVMRRRRADEPFQPARPELLRAAHWRAARYGLEGELIDIAAGRAVPAAELVQSLLAFVRPALEEAGDWDEVSALTSRNPARRQRGHAPARGFCRNEPLGSRRRSISWTKRREGNVMTEAGQT